ncbi:MAG: hypothetical protein H0W58_11695 [Acidobacteria bacterium]|nr:hypothetical protein [Acidobacteriota bacterium]
MFVETTTGVIREQITFIIMQRNITKRLSVWAAIVAAVLMIPLLAKAPWSAGDFVFGAVVLFASATVYELATRNMSNKKHRIAVGVAVLAAIALVIVWAATGPD